jgi:uncharacterized iron-regulated protein
MRTTQFMCVLLLAAGVFAGCIPSYSPRWPGSSGLSDNRSWLAATDESIFPWDPNGRYTNEAPPVPLPFESRSYAYGTTFSELLTACNHRDVVFFGEQHGNADCHAFELALLRQLARASDGRLALSLEHFERDCQEPLSAYLQGLCTEAEFLAKARPWPNYAKDYRPLIEFCKAEGIAVIASNVPRPIASRINKEGLAALDKLDPRERTWVASRVMDGDGAYKEKFFSAMGSRREDFFRAQAVKDDTMAESIALYRDQHPNHTVLHYCGQFHSEGGLGTVERLHARRPRLKLLVIDTVLDDGPMPTSSGSENGRFPTDVIGGGDILFFTPHPPKEPEKPAPAQPNPHQPNPHKPAEKPAPTPAPAPAPKK